MSKECDVCGKKPSVGKKIIRHGIPKKKGGIGLHTTGISVRRFMPNLQKVRVRTEDGTVLTATVCARCIRSGKVTKA